jgi:hypothetical protein
MTPDQGHNPPPPEDDDLLIPPEDTDGDDDSDDEDGDGKGDRAALALDVPEPEQAMAANAALAKGGKKKGVKGKGKGKAAKGGVKGADKGALAVTLGDDLIGLEEAGEPADEKEAEATAEVSAYDSDEITDIDADDIDPLMMILGGQEKPWENEKLSLVERMMIPGYERDLDALKQDGEDTEKQPRKKAAAASGIAIATAMAAHAARAQTGGGPGLAGVARGPQRAAEQEQPKTETKKTETQHQVEQQRVSKQEKHEVTSIQARQNAEEVTLRRISTGLAATLAANTAREAFDKSSAAITRSNGMDMLDFLEQQQQIQQNQDGPQGMNWTPGTGPINQFVQTLNMLYSSLEAQNLLTVSPYRQAGWDEKRLEQKENSKDVTIAPAEPERKAPAAELNYQRDYQINLGPGGM